MRRRLNRLAVAAWCGSVLAVGEWVGSGDESSDGGPPTFPVDQPLDPVILAAPGDWGVADQLAPAASESLGRLTPLRTPVDPGPGCGGR